MTDLPSVLPAKGETNEFFWPGEVADEHGAEAVEERLALGLGNLPRDAVLEARPVKGKGTICAGSTPSSIREETLREVALVWPARAMT